MKARSTSRSDAGMHVTLPTRECMTWQVQTQRRLELSYDEKLDGFEVNPDDIHEQSDNYELFVFLSARQALRRVGSRQAVQRNCTLDALCIEAWVGNQPVHHVGRRAALQAFNRPPPPPIGR